MVDTVLEDTGDTMASERPRLSLTTDVVDTEAMADTVTAGATMASVKLMPNPRPRLSLTMDMVDTEATVEATEDMEATGATVASVVATTASVKLRLSPTMAMEDTVDIVLEVTEATEVTVMAMASNMFPNCSNES